MRKAISAFYHIIDPWTSLPEATPMQKRTNRVCALSLALGGSFNLAAFFGTRERESTIRFWGSSVSTVVMAVELVYLLVRRHASTCFLVVLSATFTAA